MRLGLLPAAVLIGNPGQQWLATATPLVLQQDLATSEAFAVSLLPSSSAAYQASVAEVLQTLVEQRNGRFRIQATLLSLASQQNKAVFEEQGPVAAGIIPLLDALAKKIDSARASRFSTRNGEALRLFSIAVTAPDVASRSQLLDQAVQADPSFGLAQIARVENGPPLTELPAVPQGSFVPLDRARWSALAVRLRHAPLADQAQAMSAILQLAPNNTEALATLGTERFLQGNVTEGQRLLQTAIDLNPANASLSLQLAQGLVSAGRFPEAAKILASLSSGNANLLLSLALVELLNGQTNNADATFHRFTSFLPPGNPTISALEAQWQKFKSLNTVPPAPESVEHWQQVVQQSGDTNLAARAILGAALEQAGKVHEAHNLRILPFIPEFTDPNAPIAFNAMRRLRTKG